MKNNIKSFTLFIRDDEHSKKIADTIRKFNNYSEKPIIETDNGDLIIAIGGDGTFLNAVTSTGFDKSKIYAGIHTGTLGFLQNLSPNEIYTLIKYLSYEKEIRTRKIFVSSITVNLINEKTLKYSSLNEILIVGFNYSKISFSQYIDNELLQNVSGNGIVIATSTGETAYSLNAGGAIDFTNQSHLVCTLETPIFNGTYERFIKNPIICNNVSIVLQPADNISINIDGITKDIDSKLIKSIDVMLDGSNFINKFELETYSKVNATREKILGCNLF